MDRKELKISYTEFDGMEELSSPDRELAEAAVKAISGSYAPYSGFNVGAAVRMSSGKTVTGANQENIAYPSGLCAERTAMFSAGALYPDESMESIAIAASQHGKLCESPVSPCGACRQVMAQYQLRSGKPMSVILVGSRKAIKFDNVDGILPLVFDSLQ